MRSAVVCWRYENWSVGCGGGRAAVAEGAETEDEGRKMGRCDWTW